MRLRALIVVAAAASLAGCFHATVETGLPASSEVISKQWAHAFIYGLVPPNTVETAAKCKNGVAKVETQISFLNGLVAAITWSIYTPMQIDVTCAAGKTSQAPAKLVTPANGSVEALRQAIAEAAFASYQTRTAAFVQVQ